jgi:hypothetical protein
MPGDPTTDPDFMAAAPHDQMAYLSQTDPDFAKAGPQDQINYLMHLRGLSSMSGPAQPNIQMQKSNLGTALGSDHTGSAIANPAQPAEQFALDNPDQQGKLLGAAAIGAAGAAAPYAGLNAGSVLTGLKTAAKAGIQSLPYVAASEGINYARQHLPLGKYIPPGSEMLPFFMAGKSAEPSAASAPATPEAIAADRYQIVHLEPQQNVPLPEPMKIPAVQGVIPQTPTMEPAQSTTIAQHGYDAANQRMVMQFKNGNVYEYKGVPPEVYKSYQASESQGSFHANQIKGRYETNLIGRVPSAKMTAGQKAKAALQSQALGGQQ